MVELGVLKFPYDYDRAFELFTKVVNGKVSGIVFVFRADLDASYFSQCAVISSQNLRIGLQYESNTSTLATH